MIQIGEILKNVPFFRSLGRDSIDYITEKLKFKQFKANTVICKVGDPGDRMYIVLSGKVSVSAANGELLAYISAGNYFGEMSLLTGEPRSATITAITDTETFVLDKDDFDVILEKYPSISIAMSKIMSQRLRETNAVVSEKAKQVKTASPAGPSGSLKEKHITEILAFCEENSLTGLVELQHSGEKAIITYDKGVLQQVKYNDLSDAEAIDIMMGWEEGQFVIKPKIMTFDEETNPQALKKGIILVINQSLVVRKVIEKNLSGLGHTVNTASDITQGITALKNAKPDLIVSDFKYDELSGYDFCQQVRENSVYENIPFIFITDSNTNKNILAQLNTLSNSDIVDSEDVSVLASKIESKLS
jgi:CRP-like cAMP-binding protein/CheY-like chemotaxis protein